MPYYSFKCTEHDLFEVWQSMNDAHEGFCPVCDAKGKRKYHIADLQGDLPYKKQKMLKMGNTREEMFENFGKEGLAEEDMWKYDKDCREENTSKAGCQD